MSERKSDKTDGTAKCNIWIAARKGDGKPGITDFVTGCNTEGAARRYLEEWGLKGYAGFNWKTGKWFTEALPKDNYVRSIRAAK
jgi:hypothetical protein